MQTIHVKPWPDPVIDTLGYDARSRYVELFWLPTLGPTSILALRRFADRFDREPEGFRIPVAATSRALGLGERDGSASPLMRTITRLVQFGLASEETDNPGTVLVRRHVPPVSPKHLRRLPDSIQAEHSRWNDQLLADPARDRARMRARRVAFTLVEAGEEADGTERALERIGFLPTVASEATRWAISRHRAVQAHIDEGSQGGSQRHAESVLDATR